jgi:hypothetical protein
MIVSKTTTHDLLLAAQPGFPKGILSLKKVTVCAGANVIKLFCPQFGDFRSKLERFSLSSLSSLV